MHRLGPNADTKALPVLQVAHGYRRPIPLWFPPQLGALIVECWDEDPDRLGLRLGLPTLQRSSTHRLPDTCRRVCHIPATSERTKRFIRDASSDMRSSAPAHKCTRPMGICICHLGHGAKTCVRWHLQVVVVQVHFKC